MSEDIRSIGTINRLITYFSKVLDWQIDEDDFEDIEDISYDFEAEDLGLKEEAFAKIKSLRQLQPLVDGQKWGIFSIEFDSKKFEVTALRKVLSGLIPKKRNSADHAVWDQKDLLFLCFWGEDSNRTIGIAHFEDKEKGLPQIKMIYCAPAIEDTMQIRQFELRLKNLTWPMDVNDVQKWHDDWSSAFSTGYRQIIHDSATLTLQLAVEARGIRDRILEALEVENNNGYVHQLYEKFKDTLIHDMTEVQFADMYAQTVVYGLFSARCMDESQEDFSAAEAVECIPNTNPFLKCLMKECLGATNSNGLSYDELEIGNLVDLLQHTKTDSIIKDFNRQTGGGKEDPVIHFYEDFLTAYDKNQKVEKGVYYTPQPVVNYIVDAVDSIIKMSFGLEDGIASTATKRVKYFRDSKKRVDGYFRTQVEDTKTVPMIQILDPSTGTGTFLRQAILKTYENFREKNKNLGEEELKKAWNEYVPRHLLPRLNGFELMMAPYAVAHMKLAMILKDTGYDFLSEERLNVYLVNTLEKPGNSDGQISLFDDLLASESVAANSVKKNSGINVIMGNPPYLSASNNNGEYITDMMMDYKMEPGGKIKLQEKKNWLDDDYVKFLRWGQNIIDHCEEGILAFINPHGWLENGGFRGMRWLLMSSFDEIYIVNLHGNSKKQEKCPDGSKDENVFDIQQGVCINIFVKNRKHNSTKLAKIFYKDIYGVRENKYSELLNTKFCDTNWINLSPEANMYYLIPKDFSGADEYKTGFSVQDLFNVSSQGVMSGNDGCVMYPSFSEADDVAKKIVEASSVQEAEAIFLTKKMPKNWNLAAAKEDLEKGYLIEKIQYRPFDVVYSPYTGRSCGWHWRPRTETMMHLGRGRNNLCLVLTRIVQKGTEYNHVFVTNGITDKGILSSKDNAFVFPLYTFCDSNLSFERKSNFNQEIFERVAQKIGVIIDEDKNGKNYDKVSSYDLFCYIYAVLNSTKYRKQYKEFLIVDFPRIPFPTDKEHFWRLAELGAQLVNCHIGSIKCSADISFYGERNLVQKCDYKEDRVYVASNAWFYPISENVWNYTIGSYQPAQKWIKDRKGLELREKDIEEYLRVISIIQESVRIIDEINNIDW